MPTRSQPQPWLLSSAAPMVSLLFLSAILSCATQRGPTEYQATFRPAILFENTTTELVAVYVEERGTRYPAGHVEPGRATILTLPVAASGGAGREFVLVVVPHTSSRRVGGRSISPAGAVRSDPIAAPHLTQMRWKLEGERLVAIPLPPALGSSGGLAR